MLLQVLLLLDLGRDRLTTQISEGSADKQRFLPPGLAMEVVEIVEVTAGFPNMLPPPKRLLEGAEVLLAAGVVDSAGLLGTPRNPPPAVNPGHIR